jgi:hypothetical protein
VLSKGREGDLWVNSNIRMGLDEYTKDELVKDLSFKITPRKESSASERYMKPSKLARDEV